MGQARGSCPSPSRTELKIRVNPARSECNRGRGRGQTGVDCGVLRQRESHAVSVEFLAAQQRPIGPLHVVERIFSSIIFTPLRYVPNVARRSIWVGIPISNPAPVFSITDTGIPAGLWDRGGMISTRKPSWRKDYARQRRRSWMAAILDIIEPEIAPFDPPTPKTLA